MPHHKTSVGCLSRFKNVPFCSDPECWEQTPATFYGGIAAHKKHSFLSLSNSQPYRLSAKLFGDFIQCLVEEILLGICLGRQFTE